MERANQKLITIIGGSGFVGRHVIQKLARQGYRIRVGVRRPDLAGQLQPLGGPGQIMPVQANVRFPESIKAACTDADIVINLTGILASSGEQTFKAIHEDGALVVAKAARQAGASVFVHMSAMGADIKSDSEYCKSKARGEELVSEAFPGAMIVRPSIVFGPDDNFFNKFADMTRFSMVLPLIGGGNTRFQPVYIGDLADAFVELVGNKKHSGKIFEIGGPQVFTFKQLLEIILDVTERKRFLVPLPWFAAKIVGSVLEWLPGPLLTKDQVLMLESDNVVSDDANKSKRTLVGLGIEPETIESQVPAYLFRYKRSGQFVETGGSII